MGWSHVEREREDFGNGEEIRGPCVGPLLVLVAVEVVSVAAFVPLMLPVNWLGGVSTASGLVICFMFIKNKSIISFFDLVNFADICPYRELGVGFFHMSIAPYENIR